jgi:hypothetical protein
VREEPLAGERSSGRNAGPRPRRRGGAPSTVTNETTTSAVPRVPTRTRSMRRRSRPSTHRRAVARAEPIRSARGRGCGPSRGYRRADGRS